jgi:starch synthase
MTVALKILAVSAEAFPLAKTGGLGDAVSGLCRCLDAIGAHITLLLPAYRETTQHVSGIRQIARLEGLPGGGSASLLAGESKELGLPVYLLKNDALYDRDGIYANRDGVEYPDNAFRFSALAQVAARIGAGIASVPRPDIVHAHDWHAALTPLYLKQLRVSDVKTILTLHNIAFQGLFPMGLAQSLSIEPRFCYGDGAEFWGQLSFLKAGIRYADLITAVSRNYAREILTPKFGCGLEGVLSERRNDLLAIPNGIDTALWNPQRDPYLSRHSSFSAEKMVNKTIWKRELQRVFGLTEDRTATVMVMGSRLTTQKMADVAACAIPVALDRHPSLQVCILGHGDKDLETALRKVGERYAGRCGVQIGFDEQRAHLLHAGADILLHGSRFEPFGLTPLYALRYGAIPICSKVGGMVDTIVDPGPDQPASAMCAATGILFDGETPNDMSVAIGRAMALRALPAIWRTMQRNAMNADFSWAETAPAYMRACQALRPDIAVDQIPERLRAGATTQMFQPAFAKAVLDAANSSPASDKMGNSRRRRKGTRINTLVFPPEASAA